MLTDPMSMPIRQENPEPPPPGWAKIYLIRNRNEDVVLRHMTTDEDGGLHVRDYTQTDPSA